jgi:asparagine synthase (glutamine-hydrolysing)
MCGIAGFELAAGPNDHIGERLLEDLAHRGPDGGWFTSRGPYGFVQTRLAIVDLSPTVTYPMANEAGDVWLLFNGEVYAHRAMRTELESRGHQFRTRCDAEVMLHAYEEWGLDGFQRVDGMFALAVWDERTNELILTRDALGVKPLVYTTSGRFAFASDAMALVAAGLSDGGLDKRAIDGFAAFHYVPGPATGVSGISQVEPGLAVVRDSGGTITCKRWREHPFEGRSSGGHRVSAQEILERTSHALDESVRRQLVADVPVGVFLSSGIDSSLVLESAVRSGARPRAFTIAFTGYGDFDEADAARRFAARLGVPHVARDLRLDFHDALAWVQAAYDQPFADASALATLAVARLARDEVTVALSGTGGDDLFAGYYRHRAHLLLPLVSRAPWLARALGRESLGDERRTIVSLARSYLARLGNAAAHDDVLHQYLSLMSAPALGGLSALMLDGDAGERERVARRFGLEGQSRRSVLGAIQAFEVRTYLASDLLTKEDRATMAVGLEGRVPLLGRDMLALAESLEERQMISVFGGKRPLRSVAAARLPRYITMRRKRGFAVPLRALFEGPWREQAIGWLRSSSSTLLEPRAVAEALEARRLRADSAWAACILIAWESRLARARVGAARA